MTGNETDNANNADGKDGAESTDSVADGAAVSGTGAAAGRPTGFVFVVCLPANQQACKRELAGNHPELTPAFSRPGFLTYKVAGALPARFVLNSTMARSFGWSVNRFGSESELCQAVENALRPAGEADAAGFPHLHVWNRGWTSEPRRRDEEAELAVADFAKRLVRQFPNQKVNQTATPDERVLDIVKIDEQWWLGWHIAGTTPQRWPGGVPLLHPPEPMISRAYLKTAEALMWSGITVGRGDRCVEIGSAPGGSCQRLLDLGAVVIAVDPADLDERIATHPRLTHLKMRGRDVPHRQLAGVRWLLVDSNVAPAHTLDTVQGLVEGPQTGFRGMLLTLKLATPELVGQIGDYVQRVRAMGFRFVKTRHLAYGRQEICLLALKQKSARRFRG